MSELDQVNIFEKSLASPVLKRLARELKSGHTLAIGGVWGSSAALVVAALGRLSGRPVLCVTSHLDDADELADDIEVLTGAEALLLPAWEVDLGAEHINDEVAGERLRLCNLLARNLPLPGSNASSAGGMASPVLRGGHGNGDAPNSAATHEPLSLEGEVGPKGRLRVSTPSAAAANAGQTPATASLPPILVAPVMALLQPAPSQEALAAGRLSLERGKQLDPEQLLSWLVDAGYESVEQVDQQGEFAHRGGIVDVLAPGMAQALRVEFFGDQIESIRRFDLDTQRSTDDLERCDLTGAAAGRELDAAHTTSFLSYLPPGSIVCMPRPAEVLELARQLYQRAPEASGSAAAVMQLADPGELFLALAKFALVELEPFPTQQTGVALGVRSLERLSVNSSEALEELGQIAEVADVWVYCENPAERTRFGETLATTYPALAARLHLALGHLNTGFYWQEQQVAAVGHHEIFHRYAKVRRIRRVRAGRPIDSMLDLREGDYVVHVGHGIAKFEGLRVLDREGKNEEYLSLRFADNAMLHVPAAQINLVQKYIGSRGNRPTLSKLGGTYWSKQKDRVAAAVQDLAADLLRVQAIRRSAPGLSYPLTTPWQEQFTQEFLYSETEDQLASMQQIAQDMAEARPMDRLLCGDVGYGKTELAIRAAFKAAEAGKQVAVLVPTTVLAAQHYRTFTERFADYPFTIEMISRFRTAAEQSDVLKRLAEGKVDILIGTHRILSKDVKFKDLGLAVIDEEQRFGVEHKERLKNMRATVDVLTMTATPIPRTLHMALLGLRDISSLSTPPLDRRSIHTEVCNYDDTLVRQVILRELNRQGQVFLVHNRVMDIDLLANHIRTLVPEARVAVGHGQMGDGELEETMTRLVNREIDVLVCTTIIESGLDISTANTILIHNADRFGLAELHQLRGRVGRYKHRAYCYLLLPQTRVVSSTAAKRLKAVEEFSDLGAGFQIAMRDLEIRGAGNILGMEQSGHIAAVGYEMYCQILEQAVSKLKGEPAPQAINVHVELGLDLYIPRAYVPSDRQRMEIYRRLVRCLSVEDLRQMQADLVDAYGPIPPAMQTVLNVAEIRVRAAGAGIESIIWMEPDVIFTVRDFSAAKRVFENAPGTVRLADDHTAHWRPPEEYHQLPMLVGTLLNQFRPRQDATKKDAPKKGVKPYEKKRGRK